MIDLLWTAWGVVCNIATVIGFASIAVVVGALLAHSHAVHRAAAAQRANEQQWRDFAHRGLHTIDTPRDSKE
ncbi:hypothetical protein FAF44_02800 [Nonomuraea sp. MG754425]|uniref:hypothetical protein n=1 Tax=Nonomuraea sp. MG754425 TaxID=2570319 RepID=UPI001F44BCCF|nr:hypothetical protein [Nonomuraea sp. MG754425]MCF6467343.1 hypothetical protein [Nonomuraea sp. MG754425]